MLETKVSYDGIVPKRAEVNLNLKDPVAKTIVGKWWDQAKSTPLDQRDEIGKVYISKFLGLGDKTAEAFSQNDDFAFHQVRETHLEIQPEITTPFWVGINELFPDLHTPDEIEYLICGDKLVRINNVHRFIASFEEGMGDPRKEPSKVLGNLTRSVFHPKHSKT